MFTTMVANKVFLKKAIQEVILGALTKYGVLAQLFKEMYSHCSCSGLKNKTGKWPQKNISTVLVAIN